MKSPIAPVQRRLAISPDGQIGLAVDVHDVATAGRSRGQAAWPMSQVPESLVAAFDQSLAEGMTSLATAAAANACAGLPAEFAYWRRYARQYFIALCRQTSQVSKNWQSPHAPDQATLEELVQSAPPMLGLEYLSSEVLQSLWAALDQYTHARAASDELGVTHYLQALDPQWNLVGRVTFHLAENKQDPNRPLAFMATYTEGQSRTGSPQHIPLATALKASIESQNTEQLERLLEPVTRAAKNSKLVAELLDTRKLFAPQAWGVGQAYAFLSDVPAMEEAGVIVRVPNWWNASRPPRPQVSVRIGSKQPTAISVLDSLDLQVAVTIDGEQLSPQEIEQLLATRQGLALLRGKWVQVDTEKLQSALDHWQRLSSQHVDGIDFLQGMRLLSGTALGDKAVEGEVQAWSRVEPGDWLDQVLRQLRHPQGESAIDPQAEIQATLRAYQVAGVQWLWFATRLGLGVCLADDMGLGKTLQVISLLVQLKRHRRIHHKSTERSVNKSQPRATASPTYGPTLLIVPTSLLNNWQREMFRFAPQLDLFIAHRSATDPGKLAEVSADPSKQLASYDVVATTYGLARTSKWLREIDWQLVILDEAQAIKNSASDQTKAIKAIPAGGRIALTGTPVENHLGDLWSLFDFCSPGLLGSAAEFKRFANAKDERQRAARLVALRKLIKPYLLRRLKTDPEVVPDLPSKIEVRVDCGLSQTQAVLYSQVLEDLESTLNVASGIQRRGLVLAALIQLKQICNHPTLYLKQGQFAAKDSGKFSELVRICETIRDKQEKVLVFTQFQSMCQPLCDYLNTVFGRAGLVLSGKTAAKVRGQLVEQFQQPFGPPFFVISVKAGGTGLNLTQACHVVHFDRWWNPAVENQATDRAFRIGQKKNVLVHKFVCRGTLEERIDELIQSKQQLSQQLFGSDGELNLTEMSNVELMKFLALDLNRIEN